MLISSTYKRKFQTARFSSVARIKSAHLETCKLSFFIIDELSNLPVTLEDIKELITQFFINNLIDCVGWAKASLVQLYRAFQKLKATAPYDAQ